MIRQHTPPVYHILCLALLLRFSTAVAQPHYTIQNLGTLGGMGSWGTDLNSKGQVVGYSYTPQGYRHAFLYSEGTLSDLGTLGGWSSVAWGLNDLGQVVGDSWTGGAAPAYRGFVYSGESMRAINTLGGPSSSGADINNAGQVAGYASVAYGGWHALKDTAGWITDLGTLSGGSSYALDINSSGQIAGASSGSGGYQGFLFSNGKMVALGPLSWANGINDRGQIIGYGPGGAMIYDSGNITVLGTLGGEQAQGWGINNLGQAVGYAYLPGDRDYRAFVYEDGTLWNLNDLIPADSGITLMHAVAINDKGQILANSGDGGSGLAYLLTPIPEPSSVMLSMLVIPVLFARSCIRTSA